MFNPISDRIITIRIQGKPIHFTCIQVYAPTSTADEKEMDYFYDALQKAIDINPKGDIMYVIGDWNAKVGIQNTAGVTGSFGLWIRNERGDTMVDFCSRNSPWSRLWPDHNLLIAIVKIKLKQTKRNNTTPKYDLENIDTKYTVEVKNRFSILQVYGKIPEDLWIDIRDDLIKTAEKWIPKVKKRKVTKWLTKETIQIAEERKEAKGEGEIEKYKKLNAEFQKKARYDKEIILREKCRKIEENNKKGRTRDLYNEIKDITGSYTARCGVMNLRSGKKATEKREIKIRRQQYTEELYGRDPKIIDTFPETIYEDEPHILETEVKDAIKHI